MKKISIFGTGYVGVVSLACLVRDGHDVTGIDRVQSKIDDLACGKTPIREPHVADFIASGHLAGRLHATTDPTVALATADMVWLCVGTPSRADGSINLESIETAIRGIGDCLRQTTCRPLIVIRSTVLPGTTREILIPALEETSGLRVGHDIQLVYHPEFLREGTAVNDFEQPPKIVTGEMDAKAADPLLEIYKAYEAPRFRLELNEAELVKYCDNLFHAVKITFANEIGAIARSFGIDARRVADVFCADTKLNISPRYLRPGFAFGGSCLPKDLRAMLRKTSELSLEVPLLSSVLPSNRCQMERLIERVLERSPQRVGMVGLAFKPNTDDMRESPFVVVAKRLLGEGVDLKIYDPGVHPERLIGSNKVSVQQALAHLELLLVSSVSDLNDRDLILINHPPADTSVISRWVSAGIRIIDLADLKNVDGDDGGYEGIAW